MVLDSKHDKVYFIFELEEAYQKLSESGELATQAEHDGIEKFIEFMKSDRPKRVIPEKKYIDPWSLDDD